MGTGNPGNSPSRSALCGAQEQPFSKRSRILTRAACLLLAALATILSAALPAIAANRSTLIASESEWIAGPDYKWIALDAAHQQIFTAWQDQDRVDVLSTADYHLIHSIPIPSPSTVDISRGCPRSLAFGDRG